MSTPAPGRPVGITILAILAAIAGLFGLLGSLFVIGLGGFAGALAGGATGLAIGGAFFLSGLVSLATAVLDFAFAYGAWTLRPWAWTLGIVGAIVGIVLGLLSMTSYGGLGSLVTIAIGLAILYYLDTVEVRAAFGRPTSPRWIDRLQRR